MYGITNAQQLANGGGGGGGGGGELDKIYGVDLVGSASPSALTRTDDAVGLNVTVGTSEIISDELNHISKLTALYTELTGIAENKE